MIGEWREKEAALRAALLVAPTEDIAAALAEVLTEIELERVGKLIEAKLYAMRTGNA